MRFPDPVVTAMQYCATVALLVGMTLGVTACAGSRQQESYAGPHGHIVGAILMRGGPNNPGQPTLSGEVVAYRIGGTAVARQSVRTGQKFDLVLAPGRYRLGLGHRYPTFRNLGGCTPAVANVRQAATTHQDLSIDCTAP